VEQEGDSMKQQASLYDDEKLWLEFFKSVIASGNFNTLKDAGESADNLLAEHRKRFPKKVEEVNVQK